jgi:hypothetical protein
MRNSAGQWRDGRCTSRLRFATVSIGFVGTLFAHLQTHEIAKLAIRRPAPADAGSSWMVVEPSTVNDEELWNAVDAAYPDFKPGSKDFAVRTIRDFVNIPIGSIVMVSHGYASNANDDNPVHNRVSD